MATTFTLGQKYLDAHSAPYIIAEIGVNHGGSLEQAKKLIDLAKAGGADAAKFQTYKAETIASRHSPSYWDLSLEPTRSQYELFKKYDTFGPQDYETLAAHCVNQGIDFLSTPFDNEAIEFLNPLMPFYKVASADITNLPFLRNIASKAKPVVLSTGASTLAEIDQAVAILEDAGCPNVALLHCILNYPTKEENANLGMISSLQRAYPERLIGYSDHTLPDKGMLTLVTAYILGAKILEKHFTHDKTLPGNDHYHAMDVDDLKRFKEQINQITTLIGAESYKHPLPSEMKSRQNARRSIVLNHAIATNAPLTESMLTYKRPGTGISPMYWEDVVGRRVNRCLDADHVLQWSDLVEES